MTRSHFLQAAYLERMRISHRLFNQKGNRHRDVIMEIVLKHPADCTDLEINSFVDLVKQGGQVARTGLEARVRKAKLLGFAYDGDRLVGTSAIKRASRFYIREVFGMAMVPGDAKDHLYESGWTYVLPEYRKQGTARHLLHALLESHQGNIFGTSGATNEAVRKLLD